MEAMFRRIVVLAVALGLTWMVFYGANYFGAVWTHYFSGEPDPKNAGEVSVKIVPAGKPPCPRGQPC
jgi:hypothetical protein